MRILLIAAASIAFLYIPIEVAHGGPEEDLINLNRKCGPLSGKRIEDMDPETRHQCEEYPARANKNLGLPGPGFAVSPEAHRKMEFDAWKRQRDAFAEECRRQGTYEGECHSLAPAELQVQRRKDAVDQYCRDHGLAPNCPEAAFIPGRTR